jgi:hypothetical protein
MGEKRSKIPSMHNTDPSRDWKETTAQWGGFLLLEYAVVSFFGPLTALALAGLCFLYAYRRHASVSAVLAVLRLPQTIALLVGALLVCVVGWYEWRAHSQKEPSIPAAVPSQASVPEPNQQTPRDGRPVVESVAIASSGGSLFFRDSRGTVIVALERVDVVNRSDRPIDARIELLAQAPTDNTKTSPGVKVSAQSIELSQSLTQSLKTRGLQVAGANLAGIVRLAPRTSISGTAVYGFNRATQDMSGLAFNRITRSRLFFDVTDLVDGKSREVQVIAILQSVEPPSPPKSPEKPNPQRSITQQSSGPNSPNIVVGDNSQATILYRDTLALSTDQSAALTTKVRTYAGRRIKIFLNRETTETAQFGAAVKAALVSAGVDVVDVVHMDVLGPVPPGIFFILSKSTPGDPEFAQALAKALADVGVIKSRVQAEYGNNDVLILYITPL